MIYRVHMVSLLELRMNQKVRLVLVIGVECHGIGSLPIAQISVDPFQRSCPPPETARAGGSSLKLTFQNLTPPFSASDIHVHMARMMTMMRCGRG